MKDAPNRCHLCDKILKGEWIRLEQPDWLVRLVMCCNCAHQLRTSMVCEPVVANILYQWCKQQKKGDDK